MSSKKILKSISVISVGTVIARVFGLGREVATANFFGTTLIYDAFLIAFMIPNFFRGLLAEGALNNAFIPVFTSYVSEPGNKKEEFAIYNICFTFSLLMTSLLMVVSILLSFLFQGMASEGSKWFMVWHLLRYTFPYLIFISITALNIGVLNTYKVFLLPAFSPVILDLFWVGSLFIALPLIGNSLEDRIIVLCAGVVAGGLGQFLFTLIPVLRRGFRIRLSFNFRHPAIKRMGRLLAPVVIGVAVVPINLLVDYSLAGLLAEGAVSGLWYSTRLFQLPLGIFGISISTAILPWFSENISMQKYDEFRNNLIFCMKVLTLLMLPFTFGLIVFRNDIVALLFLRGIFDTESIFLVAYPLIFYSLGLLGYGGVSVISRAFYAVGDTVTPVKVGILSVVTNLVLNVILMRFLQHGGIALSTAVVGITNFVFLLVLFNKKHIPLGLKRLDKFFVKVLLASSSMGLAGFLFRKGIERCCDFSLPLALFTGIIFSVLFYLLFIKLIFWKTLEIRR